jgi:hypothetical protein
MSLPGFGAEASLYRSTGQYRAALAAGLAQPSGIAIPQQIESPIISPWTVCVPRVCPPSGVQYCCYWSPFGHGCFFHACRPAA